MTKFESIASAAAREFSRFSADESGATAIEYAMVASGVGVAVAATVFSLGSKVNSLFNSVATLFN